MLPANIHHLFIGNGRDAVVFFVLIAHPSCDPSYLGLSEAIFSLQIQIFIDPMGHAIHTGTIGDGYAGGRSRNFRVLKIL